MGNQMGNTSGRKIAGFVTVGIKITPEKEDGLKGYKGKSACNPAWLRSKHL